jgi:NAD(P)-dependent dehydrogenase (short-subunit alcohol dehydrogenase family)
MQITGRTALVTGAARRVGRVLALALADAGANVVVHFHTSHGEAEQTAAAIEARGGRAALVRGDVARHDDVARIIDCAQREFGGLDILVNSASVFERKPLLDITEADWDRVLAVNLKGPFMLSQAAAPLLRRHGGVIVNILDLSALQPWPSFAHHAVSKAGLLQLTRVLARALAPDVRVNAISPGTVLAPEEHAGDDGERRLTARAGDPADVVEALLYLVRSDFVTGENLVVDGGRMLL